MYNVTCEVIFRYWNDAVIALFPYEITDLEGNCSSYMTIGQHGAASYKAILRESRLATPEEYASLEKELVHIGYRLKIIQRRNYQKYRRAFVSACHSNQVDNLSNNHE